MLCVLRLRRRMRLCVRLCTNHCPIYRRISENAFIKSTPRFSHTSAGRRPALPTTAAPLRRPRPTAAPLRLPEKLRVIQDRKRRSPNLAHSEYPPRRTVAAPCRTCRTCGPGRTCRTCRTCRPGRPGRTRLYGFDGGLRLAVSERPHCASNSSCVFAERQLPRKRGADVDNLNQASRRQVGG